MKGYLKMVNRNLLETMYDYSGLGSWAVWESEREDGSFKNDKDIKIDIDFSLYKNELQKTNTVILAMNPGGTFIEKDAETATRKIKFGDYNWGNFHSQGGNDSRLAEALRNTPEWGSYMTDIFPIVGSDSETITKFINNKKNENVVQRLIHEFDEEMLLLFSGKSEIELLCIGDKSFKWAKKFLVGRNSKISGLKNTYKIYQLPHYSGSANGSISKKCVDLGFKKKEDKLEAKHYSKLFSNTLTEQRLKSK